MLSAQDLSFCLQDKVLLSQVNLTLKKGKLYAIIGHNGSGKSTLIKLLAGEQAPTSGVVTYQNDVYESDVYENDTVATKKDMRHNLHKMPAKARAKNVAYLPQKLPDAQNFTVEELVMLGRYPWQKWLQKPSDADHKIVATAMSQAKIADKYAQTVATLSGGERARVWLAMCLAQQTNFLLLDEPLAALDIVYQVEVLRLIKKLVDKKGLGVVMIIHDINLASQFCDEFIALKQGKVCHKGAIDELMTPAILQDIFGINLHILKHPVSGLKVAVV